MLSINKSIALTFSLILTASFGSVTMAQDVNNSSNTQQLEQSTTAGWCFSPKCGG